MSSFSAKLGYFFENEQRSKKAKEICSKYNTDSDIKLDTENDNLIVNISASSREELHQRMHAVFDIVPKVEEELR